MKEIAADLRLSTRTVETHKCQMMQALGVALTAELFDTPSSTADRINGSDLVTCRLRLSSFTEPRRYFLRRRHCSSPVPHRARGIHRIRGSSQEHDVLAPSAARRDHAETAELLRGLLQPEFDVVAVVRGRTSPGQPSPRACRRT